MATTELPKPASDPMMEQAIEMGDTSPFEEPKPEPVRIPLDETGNPAPVKSFTDLVSRNYAEDATTQPYDGLPEAGGIAWFDANLQKSEKGLVLSVNRLNITARADTPRHALNDILFTLVAIEKLGIKVHLEPAATSVAKAPTDSRSTAVQPTKPWPEPGTKSTAPTNAPKPVSQAPAPAQQTLNAESESRARIVKIVSVPLPGGKYQLKFHEAGHPKYPDYQTYKAGMELDAIMAILDASGYQFTPDMLSPTNEVAFDVNCELYWRFSQAVNSKGNHYRNFSRLAPVGE